MKVRVEAQSIGLQDVSRQLGRELDRQLSTRNPMTGQVEKLTPKVIADLNFSMSRMRLTGEFGK